MGDVSWPATPAIDIEEVIQRMDAIDAALPSADGVATFNRMYRQVTLMVKDAIGADRFVAGPFLGRLDVHFANLFFEAYAAGQAGRPVPRAWAPLFEARSRPDTHPIQFALAGMNAHISHDLAIAVVDTCKELGSQPKVDTPEHTDFTATNRVLAEATDEIKSWFISGTVARIDEIAGKLDDGIAMFGIHTARAAAWETAEIIWHVNDKPRLHSIFVDGLARTVALTSRGILL